MTYSFSALSLLFVPWGEALKGAFFPSISLQSDYLTTLIAILGTTISPYLFFWHGKKRCVANSF